MKTLPLKSRMKNQGGGHSHQLAIALKLTSNQSRIENKSLSESSTPLSLSDSCESEDQDDCGLVDALTTAVSHVRISEPKRSRVCGPTGPIEQQCSSNMKANNLCKAF